MEIMWKLFLAVLLGLGMFKGFFGYVDDDLSLFIQGTAIVFGVMCFRFGDLQTEIDKLTERVKEMERHDNDTTGHRPEPSNPPPRN